MKNQEKEIHLDKTLNTVSEDIKELKGILKYNLLTDQTSKSQSSQTNSNASLVDVPESGIVENVDLSSGISIILWWELSQIEGVHIADDIYLSDVFSSESHRNRVSMYARTIENKNYIVVRLFDDESNVYRIEHCIDEWKNNTAYFLGLTFSPISNEIILYINGEQSNKIKIDNLSFSIEKSDVFIGRSYLIK